MIPRPFGLGIFCGGRYRARTARPRRRRGNQSPSGALISARFPTARNVYRDDYRFVVDGTGLKQQRRPQRNRIFHSTGGYSSIGEYGILGLVQQIKIWRGDLHEKERIKNRRFGNADYSCCIYNVCGEPSRNEFSLEQYHYLVTVWFVCSCDSRAAYCA